MSSDIHLMAISQEIIQPSITKFSLKITWMKLYSNLPGANELMVWEEVKTNMFMYKEAMKLHVVLTGCSNNSGGRLNKKDGLTRYGDSHVKDKTS